MNVLLVMRDALPPSRADVRVLFDRALRAQGIATDFAGTRHSHGTVPAEADACRGNLLEAGRPGRRPPWWRLAATTWRHAARYDVVIARDLPVAGALVLAIARLRGRRAAYWMSFPIPLGDRAGAAAHWSNRRYARAALVFARGCAGEAIQRHITLPLAHTVFVQSERMRADLVQRGVAPRRVAAVPMGIDASQLPAVESPGPASADRPPCIVYLGTLGRARRLDVLIDALALLLPRLPSVRLVFIGGADDAADVAWLHAHAARRGVAHATDFLGPRPMREAWHHVARAAVAVSPIPPGPLHDVSSPTKVIEYLALGVPVVASRIPDQEQILAACGGGACVDFSAAGFAEALMWTLADPVRARAGARAARECVLALRSYDLLAATVAQRLRALASGA